MTKKKIIIINSFILLFIIVFIITQYFPSLLDFSDKHYRRRGGDYLTESLLSGLFIFGCGLFFIIFNSVILIKSIIRKNKNRIITILIFISLLIIIIITLVQVNQYRFNKGNEEKILWSKKAIINTYKSDKLRISFTYTDIMPGNKKVKIHEKNNQIIIYTEGYKERADRIILLKKDTTMPLLDFLNKNPSDNALFSKSNYIFFYSVFSEIPDNDKIEEVELYYYDNKDLQKHTGLTYEDLGISVNREIEDVYFISNKKYPSRYYAIVLMPDNERVAATPTLETMGTGKGDYYSTEDIWANSLRVLE